MVAQIPQIDTTNELRPETFKGGFVYAVNFKLPKPAEQDGYIIQKIRQVESGTIHRLEKDKDGSSVLTKTKVNREIFYWEAWEIKKGETTPRQQQSISEFVMGMGGGFLKDAKYQNRFNDIFFRNYEIGSMGKYYISGFAAFYHTNLSSDFIVGHPQTGAGQLRSTLIEPTFWSKKCGLFRELTFDFNFMDDIIGMKGTIICPNPIVWDIRELAKAFGY